jgi:hypothetical protein
LSNNSVLEKRQDGTDKSISIWYRPAFDKALVEIVGSFSRSAAMVFSEVWRKQLESGSNVLVIEGTNTEPYKRIVNWINMCIDEGNDVKFPDVSPVRP